ncbi:MAG: T9SS C-terminal target domain-containing protein [Bacteroidetes bacterium]|nr:MAG: T9SS C-terminal target domain-containing protein [Bacteroidota bacterium]
MKTKTFLFALIFCLNAVTAWGLNSLCVTSVSPSSPAALQNGEQVEISFDYQIDEPGGARIFIRPTTGDYSASGSPLYTGSGSGTANFTISSGEVVVEELRVRITNSDQSAVLFEYYVPVKLIFGPNAARLKNIPAKASFLLGEDATFDFDYAISQAGGARIFIRPYTNGSLTSSYSASGSPNFSGSGTASANFTINSGVNVKVDALRVRITNDDQSAILLEYFVPVEWYFSTVKVSNIVPGNGGDAFLSLNTQVTTSLDYETTEAGGVRIFIRPFSDSALTSSYSASGSSLYTGSGSISGNFTINGGNALVDHLRIRCTNADQSQVLLEYFVPVHYAFGDIYLSELTYCPDTPARLMNGDDVTLFFSHNINVAGGVRIFIRPFSQGALASNYATSGSPSYTGTGDGDSRFTISSGNVVVDELRVRITTNDQSATLMEYFVPVHFVFGDRPTAIDSHIPDHWQLGLPYPNPFTEELHFPLKVDKTQRLQVEVLNAVGQRVAQLFDGLLQAGQQKELTLNGLGLPAGIYTIRVWNEHGQASRKVVLAR